MKDIKAYVERQDDEGAEQVQSECTEVEDELRQIDFFVPPAGLDKVPDPCDGTTQNARGNKLQK